MRWFNIVTNFLGIVGTIFGFYAYFAMIEKRDPVLVKESNSKILEQALISEAPIKISKKDDSPIYEDVYVGRFYFFNRGKEPIKREDVLEPIRFQIGQDRSEILDYKILKISRPVTGITLKPDSTKRFLDLDFRILEQGDGIAVQVVYSATCTCLSTLGAVTGVKYIHESDRSIPNRIREESFFTRFIIIYVWPFFAVFLIWTTWAGMRKKYQGSKRIIGLGAVVIVAAVCIWFYYGILTAYLKTIKENIPSELVVTEN